MVPSSMVDMSTGVIPDLLALPQPFWDPKPALARQPQVPQVFLPRDFPCMNLYSVVETCPPFVASSAQRQDIRENHAKSKFLSSRPLRIDYVRVLANHVSVKIYFHRTPFNTSGLRNAVHEDSELI